jgi:toxin ParE1/3/4
MSRYRFSSAAEADIEKIALYILGRNPVAASRFLDSLDSACELLAENPFIGRSRPELGQDLRSFAVGSYLVFYVPGAEGIDVARVIYGGRDLPGIFGSKA